MQRRQEIEQKLAEIVSKQRAKQKEEQQQEAATESAKYAGSKDFEQARQAAKKPALPKDVQAALLRKINSKQAKAGTGAAIAKGSQDSGATSQVTQPSGSLAANGSGVPLSSYSFPTLPTGQAQFQLPLGHFGKGILNLVFPLTIPAPITSAFGWRVHPISGTPRFHRGLDLGAPMGTPVLAAQSGRVDTADFLSGYGLTIILRHGNTQQTLYAHLSQVLVKPGDWVKQGQLIGQVGSTGASTGPHLHFELHQLTSEGWTALDPGMVFNQANATAQNPQSQQLAKGKGQSLRLAAFGLLDLNDATTLSSDRPLDYSALSNYLSVSSPAQTGMLVPFAVLPSAVPEFSWFLSPIVDDLLAEQSTALMPWLGFSTPTHTVSVQTLPFQPAPVASESTEPLAFKPLATPADPSTLRLATTQPFVNLITAKISIGVQYLQAFGATVQNPTSAPSSQPVLNNTPTAPPLELQRIRAIKNNLSRNRTNLTRMAQLRVNPAQTGDRIPKSPKLTVSHIERLDD
ncbi:MAG: peptidoglycan DD-metalloendopeptidase family protein [Leptolyngbyaceae cyanobacterium RU_5_1]|nr:peptidoglycan DD-metalloendopeptidase family protein [Leptolyngbyaceae cyanobacterium RU_5_1]